jgi:predicted O-methyltransferase YrrM
LTHTDSNTGKTGGVTLKPENTETRKATEEQGPGPSNIRQDLERVLTSPPETSAGFRRVQMEKLHEELGFTERLDAVCTGNTETFQEWDMETRDQPVLRYIFRNFRPKRHLEFGTGQGRSTVYCLEECDATVYTINAPTGAIDMADGRTLYPMGPKETEAAREWGKRLGIDVKEGCAADTLIFIGREYMEKGYGRRVCQIYSDSVIWETKNFPDGFFDSVFIDGSREISTLINDTKKAIPLLRPGGIILWYNFFVPHTKEELLIDNSVTGFIASRQVWLEPFTTKMFWIYPSKIYLGVRI